MDRLILYSYETPAETVSSVQVNAFCGRVATGLPQLVAPFTFRQI